MESEIASNQSPLAGLYRSTRQRRSSPLAATRSRRGSPLSYTAPDPPFPSVAARNALAASYDKFDDSDDEGKAPQLSALARMLLDEFPEPGVLETKKEDEQEKQEIADEGLRRSPLSRYSISRKRITWSQSPDPEERSGSAPRTGSSQGSSRRFTTSRDGSPDRPTGREFVTPAAAPRYSRRAYSGGQDTKTDGLGLAGATATHDEQLETRYNLSGYASIVRSGAVNAGPLPQSTTASAMRWKRAGRGLLGPVGGAPRRGPRRESDPSDVDEGRRDNDDIPERNSSSPEEAGERESSNGDISRPRMGSASPTSGDGKETHYEPEPIPTISRRPRRASPESLSGQYQMNVYYSASPESDIGHVADVGRSASPVSGTSRPTPIVTTPATAPAPQAKSDKENMPPPAFRRPAIATSSYKRLDSTLEKPPPPVFQGPPVLPSKMEPLAPASPPPEKRALTAKTGNTPLRPVRQAPPPPPPKMSLLEAVTATAGAAATKTSQNTRKNRSTVTINGKPYRRLDAIGKGGSCKVYKVMAENHKMFAMKKVTFHEQDGPAAILGYKGEIDLLKRLSGEERVIRLYDYEMNEEKQTLTMVKLSRCILSLGLR